MKKMGEVFLRGEGVDTPIHPNTCVIFEYTHCLYLIAGDRRNSHIAVCI